MAHARPPHRSSRFHAFLRELSQLVESESDEQALLSRCRDAVARLVALDDWLPEDYRRPDAERYQQYLLYCDPQERFSVVSFVWGPGQSTPIHNHETWGVIGILEGAEVCQDYRLSDEGLVAEGAAKTLRRGDVVTLSPATGDIHQVRNGLEDKASVAIHVYGSDIGSQPRFIISMDGARKPFISRYVNDHLPNFWLPDDR